MTELTSSSGGFAEYLAKVYVAQKGYRPGTLPEAAELARACDAVLTYSDGVTFAILCLIDGQRHPGKRFALSREDVLRIAEGCKQYTGTVNGARMPVVIQLVEVTAEPVTPDDSQRLRALRSAGVRSKIAITAWQLDTVSRSVWTNAPFNGWLAGRRFFQRLLRSPQALDAELALTPAALREPVIPLVTYGLLAALVAVFGFEAWCASQAGESFFSPSPRTLLALGALSSDLVLEQGEWTRLLSCILLHADPFHLLCNGIALYLGGVWLLETLVGRAWFLALFILGGLGGSLASLALNPVTTVSVGASGAIMGLLAGAFVSSFRFASQRDRMAVQMRLLRVLVPSLIPLATSRTGHTIDFAAHLGGAMTGALTGLSILKTWPREQMLPRFAGVAAAIVVTGFVVWGFGFAQVSQHLPDHSLRKLLIPPAELPKNQAELSAHAFELIQKYPRDPRAHLWYASVLLEANEAEAAIPVLRAGLAESRILEEELEPEFKWRLRGVLALILKDHHRLDEALQLAAPACQGLDESDFRSMLVEDGLCLRRS